MQVPEAVGVDGRGAVAPRLGASVAAGGVVEAADAPGVGAGRGDVVSGGAQGGVGGAPDGVVGTRHQGVGHGDGGAGGDEADQAVDLDLQGLVGLGRAGGQDAEGHGGGVGLGKVMVEAGLDGAVRLSALSRRGIRRTGSIGRAAQPQRRLERRLRRGVRVNQGGDLLRGLVRRGTALDAVELGLVLVGQQAVVLACAGGGGVTDVGLEISRRRTFIVATLYDFNQFSTG